jgi:peptidoglycan/LPS O-acetylase OafA/YrhL
MPSKSYLPELEGLRGLAALWVLIYHLGALTGVRLPIIRSGGLGVDLFVLLSGFLMVHQYEQRRESQPWSSGRTIGNFYCRRFFRIAPLYYLLLAASFAAAPAVERWVLYIRQHSSGYMDIHSDTSWANLLVHLSFAFGFLPHFSDYTDIPDWTIGLEVQFYVFFPFLMLLVLRLGYLKMAAITLLLAVSINLLFFQFVSGFPMASFLPLKIHIFLLGMLIAAAFHGSVRLLSASICVVLLPLIPLIERVHRFGLPWLFKDMCLSAVLLLITCGGGPVRVALNPLRASLNAWLMQRLGDISYSVYLVHLLLMPPIIAMLLHIPWCASLGLKHRFVIFGLIVMLVVFPVSLILYYFVESPGIALGKRLLGSRSSIRSA